MNLNAIDKLAAARAQACKMAPYFRTLILSLIPVEKRGLNTLGVTEHLLMYWCPDFVNSISQAELAAVIIHEALHVLYRHHARAKALGVTPEQAEQWNYAGDAAINDSIGALPLPPDCVTPASLGLPSGLTAEGYFRALLDKQAKNTKQENQGQPKQGQDKQQSGQGQNNASQQSGQNNNNSNGQGTPKPQSQGQSGQGQKKARQCGGCAGHAHEIEKELNKTVEGRTQAESNRVIRQTAEAVKQAAAKGQGNVSGGLAVWAEQTLAPAKVNWRVKLTQLVRDAKQHKQGAVTHKYCKPSRRQAGLGYGMGRATLPALISPLPRVAIALDTSGSMVGPALAKAMAEVNGVIKAIGAPIDFVAFDIATGKLASVNTVAEAAKLIVGGGGTSFVPVLDKLAKQKEKPDIVIVLTDGYGDAPAKQPPYKVVWALINGRAPVQWGHTVTVEG